MTIENVLREGELSPFKSRYEKAMSWESIRTSQSINFNRFLEQLSKYVKDIDDQLDAAVTIY
jgi:adenylosuccinate synthase